MRSCPEEEEEQSQLGEELPDVPVDPPCPFIDDESGDESENERTSLEDSNFSMSPGIAITTTNANEKSVQPKQSTQPKPALPKPIPPKRKLEQEKGKENEYEKQKNGLFKEYEHENGVT